MDQKKTYSRPTVTDHGSAAEKTLGTYGGENYDFNGQWRRRPIEY
ncbi:MAG TPA: lasso RiPP family leader peptide-containing protein [Longimicrobiaceae bacterium]|nr:lasso RiPP family leader peptide-containing protein [Longimicrobiaceae bacterium]